MSRTKSWGTDQRFKTALDWINASIERGNARGLKLDDDIKSALADCCVKRNGDWTLRKTEPKPDTQYLVYKAFQIARHAHKWGDLAPWNEAFTGRLMRANDDDRSLFDRAFDQFSGVNKS